MNNANGYFYIKYRNNVVGYLKITVLTDSMPCTKYKSLEESDVELCREVNELSNDVAYLFFFFSKFTSNSSNLGIRGNGITVIMTNSKIKSLIEN